MMSENVHDLIYAGGYRNEIEATILKAFPDAKIEDASDEIHRGRAAIHDHSRGTPVLKMQALVDE